MQGFADAGLRLFEDYLEFLLRQMARASQDFGVEFGPEFSGGFVFGRQSGAILRFPADHISRRCIEAGEAEGRLTFFRFAVLSFDFISECGTDRICFNAPSKAAYSPDSFLAEGLGWCADTDRSLCLCAQSQDGLPEYVSLREEAIKSWDYFVSNEIVHVPKVIHDQNDAQFLRADGLQCPGKYVLRDLVR
jgi:hypothetical protein